MCYYNVLFNKVNVIFYYVVKVKNCEKYKLRIYSNVHKNLIKEIKTSTEISSGKNVKYYNVE